MHGDVVVSNFAHVSLTPESQSRTGAVFSKKTLSGNWMVEAEFKIGGSNSKTHGDGMAFWYTTKGFVPGKALGNANRFEGLGVLLRTFDNRQQHSAQSVAVMVNDGSFVYDQSGDVRGAPAGQCQAHFRGVDHRTRVRVEHYRGTLRVLLDVDGKDGWRTCFVAKGVNLVPEGFIGFTASTGAAADKHQLVSVTAAEIIEPPRDLVGGSVSGGTSVYFVLLLVAALVVFVAAMRRRTKGYQRI